MRADFGCHGEAAGFGEAHHKPSCGLISFPDIKKPKSKTLRLGRQLALRTASLSLNDQLPSDRSAVLDFHSEEVVSRW